MPLEILTAMVAWGNYNTTPSQRQTDANTVWTRPPKPTYDYQNERWINQLPSSLDRKQVNK